MKRILAALLLLAAPAAAQDAYPSRPITLISPFNPGGVIDVFNRLMAEKMSRSLGQPVVVVARPGASTIIGAQETARAAPDGYTFMITTSTTLTNNVALRADLPYKPEDFQPVTIVAFGSVLLVGKADAPYKNLREFADWAKKQNRPITFGSWGIGSSGHLFGELLKSRHGLAMTHVPYRGEVPAIADVIGGTLDVTFCSPVGSKPQIAAGKIVPLGMTGNRRSSAMPELPTFGEQGFEGFDLVGYSAAYLPARTPRPIVEKLFQALKAAGADPDVQAKFAQFGQTPVFNTPEEFAALYAREYPRWAELLKASGAKVE